MSFKTLNKSFDDYQKKLYQRVQDNLNVIGAWGVTVANNALRSNGSVVTSNLINSINYATQTSQGSLQGATDGKQISQPNDLSVRIGSTVVYARRLELGFTGQDSLGRTYNQPAKPYLRVINKNKDKIVKLLTRK